MLGKLLGTKHISILRMSNGHAVDSLVEFLMWNSIFPTTTENTNKDKSIYNPPHKKVLEDV